MGDGPDYETQLKRRRDGRTDYGKRLELLKAGDIRAVVRLSNRNCTVQLVRYSDTGDATVTSARASDLEAFGWDAHTGNVPAAYLTGVLAGYRAIQEGVERAIADIGLRSRASGGRHYAAVNGLKDAGLDVPADEAVFPAEERVKGVHLGADGDGVSDAVTDVTERIASEYGGSDG